MSVPNFNSSTAVVLHSCFYCVEVWWPKDLYSVCQLFTAIWRALLRTTSSWRCSRWILSATGKARRWSASRRRLSTTWWTAHSTSDRQSLSTLHACAGRRRRNSRNCQRNNPLRSVVITNHLDSCKALVPIIHYECMSSVVVRYAITNNNQLRNCDNNCCPLQAPAFIGFEENVQSLAVHIYIYIY